MLTAKQRELLLFIDARLNETGISPSFDEMREALELKSKSGVHRLISALEERGFIRRLPNRARALEVVKLPELRSAATVTPIRPAVPAAANDTIEIPLHGRIAAGTPIEALQGTECFPVPAALLGPGEHYALEVSGDSMVDEGSRDGDFALVRKVDGAVESRWVELQPPGAASARQAAAGDGDIRIGARARDRIPVDPVRGPRGEQPPFGLALANDGDARVSRTGAVRKRTEISRV